MFKSMCKGTKKVMKEITVAELSAYIYEQKTTVLLDIESYYGLIEKLLEEGYSHYELPELSEYLPEIMNY